MSTKTLGTNGTTTLTALVQGTGTAVTADVASIANAIKNDLVNGHPIYPGAYERQGLLYIPNRGLLKVLAGDWIGVDATGWPILVSANAIASADPATSWTHS